MADYFRHEAPPKGEAPDLSDWPEDVRETVEAVCRVFNLRPPARGRRKAGSFAFWIQAARELEDACRPHRPREVLEEVQRDVTMALHRGQGITIAGPQSLVNLARAKAGQLSARSVFVPQGEEAGEDGFLECPRCKSMVNPLTLDDRCEGSHYSRGFGPELGGRK
jgi:hypothetical protein